MTMRSLRPGSTCQLGTVATLQKDAMVAAATQQHGNWVGNTGERVYQHRVLDRADAQALYTTEGFTFEHLKFLYMTETIAAAAPAAAASKKGRQRR